ncbi:unnamed protein product, partial [Brassica rapa]
WTATDVLCVLTDTHRHTLTATDVLCVLTDTHGCPVCADRHPRTSCVCGRTHTDNSHGQPWTSCVCWQTPTDVLCVLNRQPTWAKITQTVPGKGQRVEPKDERADMCTNGQPLMSCTDTHGHTQTATDILCVLAYTHRRPVSTDVLCVLADTHGRPLCTEGHPQTSCVYSRDSPQGTKSPEQSTGWVSVLNPRTNVLICVLMDSHRRPVCADGHTQTHTDNHGCPVCADGHTRTSCPTWAKIIQPVHGKGQRAESKDQRADMSTDVMCVLTDTHGHTQTATDVLSTNVLCVLTDSHRKPQTSCLCWRTPTDVMYVLCVLVDTHGRPECTDQTAHVGQNHPNSPREGSTC